ncbi:MAG: extracellular solute-binding protein [Trueperaceae bacterium]|nr:extracellular solute-binding protein [Trueperaceae bacterium]
MRRAVAVVLAALVASAAFAQTTLTVGVFEPLHLHIERMIERWHALYPDVNLEIRGLGYGDHHDALVTQLATGSGAPDVVAIEIGYIARFIADGGLRDLSAAPFNADRYEDRFVDYAWNQARSNDGRQIALPTDIGPGVMWYRRDRLEASGWTIEQVTESMQSLIEFGRDLKEQGVFLIADAGTVAGAFIRSDIPEGDGIYFNAAGEPQLNSERFVQAATYAKMIRDEGLDARIGSWSNEWYENFRLGTSAIEMSGAWLGGHLANWMAPETAGQWGVSELPGGMLLSWGGSFYGIPTTTPENKLEAAWNLVQFLTVDPEIALEAFTFNDAFPALPETYGNAVFQEALPFLGGQQARLLYGDVAQRIPGVATFTADVIAQEMWDSALAEILNEGRDIQEALDEAQSLVQRRLR